MKKNHFDRKAFVTVTIKLQQRYFLFFSNLVSYFGEGTIFSVIFFWNYLTLVFTRIAGTVDPFLDMKTFTDTTDFKVYRLN